MNRLEPGIGGVGVGKASVGLAWLTLTGSLAVLVAGALVNAQQAALSVPTWPLSYGHLLLPEWVGNTFYEQLHRLLVVVTSVLYIGLFAATRRGPGRLRGLVATGLALLALQVLLGGVVVLWLDPPLVAALHLLLAIAVVVVTAGIVVRAHGTRTRGSAAAWAIDGKNLRRARRLFVLLVLQAVLGAVSRHPPGGQTLFIVTLLAHALNGLVIVVLAQILGISLAHRSAAAGPRLLGASIALAALAQLSVGIWVFLISPEPLDEQWPPPDGFPTAHALHIVLATLLIVAVALLARRSPGRAGRGAIPAESRRHARLDDPDR